MTAQQLKNSILQMAVQGKLVPQNPDDEPASELLKRIKAEKERLIKEKKIKKEKNPSEIFIGDDNLPYEKCGLEVRCIADEVPFEIPSSWGWVRFSNLVNFSMGKTPPRKESEYWCNAIYPWVSIADMPADGTVLSTKEKVNQYAADNTFKNSISPVGTLIMSFKLTVGKVSILGINAYHNEAIISIFPYIDNDRIVTTYLFKVLPLIAQNGDTKTAIKGATLNSDSLSNLLIPIPPISEQRRIVDKITELEPSVNAYEKAETQLSALNTTFPEALKKSILQQAVMGKLVPQNPDDEPASVLLERIRAEKQALVKAGKIKKDKNDSVIYRRDNSHYESINGVERCIDEEIPFEVPETWEWCRLGSVFQHNTGKALNSSNHQGTNMTYITTSNLYWNRFELNKLKEMPFTESEIEKCTVAKGDLLVCEGGDIGRAAVWNYGYPMRIQNHIHRLRPYTSVDIYYFYFIFYFYKHAGLIGGKGIGIQGLSSNAIDKLLIPLPPLTEQHRIVEKINELQALISDIP